MRRFLIFAATFTVAQTLFAASQVAEMPVTQYGTPTTVSVSTSAWTKVPATSSLTGRVGILVKNDFSNNAKMVGILDSCSSTSIATTVRPLGFSTGSDFTLIPVNDNVCLYLLSLHTAAENVHVQEVSQR